MTTQFQYSTTLVLEYCYACGVPFGMPADFRGQRLKDHRNFFCPNGHSQHYVGKTDAEKLREEREHSAALSARLDQANASNRALRGVVTRRGKELARAKGGVCPVDGCRRHFSNLGRHMETKHPGWKP